MVESPPNRQVLILGANADIGVSLLKFFRRDGWSVAGTYRKGLPAEVEKEFGAENFFRADFSKPSDITELAAQLQKINFRWDAIVSAVGSMLPIGRFVDLPFEEWEKSLHLNAISQLRAVHALYPLRREQKETHVVLFAGGGTNGPFTNYSAYCVSKIALIKMCELLHDECSDLNPFIVGPGWVRTKIHDETMGAGANAGVNLAKTADFMKSNEPGTSLEDIYRCIAWGISMGRKVCGGRNFSVVHDKWGSVELSSALERDSNLYKLRRFSIIGDQK